MTSDDLLEPSVTAAASRRRRPWRLRSQFWVAFAGGALACATIAIINGRRLGVPRKQRWLMAALTAVALGALLVLWLQRPPSSDFGTFFRTARDMRLYGRIAAVALYLALAALQRKADAHHQVFSDGEYASLWGPGAAAVIVGGTIQPLLLAGTAWVAR